MSKYHGITEETKVGKNGKTVHRLIALETFENRWTTINKGTLGGWVQNIENIHDNAWVYDDAELLDSAEMFDHSHISHNSSMWDYSNIHDKAGMWDNSALYNRASMWEYASIAGKSEMWDSSSISDYTNLRADARVIGSTYLRGNTELKEGAYVSESWQVLTLNTHTTRGVDVTLYPTKSGKYHVKMGCLEGTVDELEELFKEDEWVETTGQDVQDAREEMLAMVALMRARIKRNEARK